MELKDLQKECKKIVDGVGDSLNRRHTKDEAFIHLVEEIGEIGREINNQRLRPEKFDKENFKKEFADTLLFLLYLAEIYNVDIQKAIKEKMNELKKRFNLE